MKKIIIARSILDAIGGHDTIFRRGTIMTFPARTCEEILSTQIERKADMIITELDLPVMGGARLCEEIRKNQELKMVSVIMVCDGSEASLAQCSQMHVNAVLSKPLDPVQLYSEISELLVIPQRKDLRVLLRASLTGTEEKTSFFGMTHNISLSGMLLETDRDLKAGDKFSCMINVGHREIGVRCEVVRVLTVKGRYRYGVKFLNPDTKSLIIIEQFVKGGIKH